MSVPILSSKYPEPSKMNEYIKYSEIRQMADNLNYFYLKNVNHPVSFSVHSLDSQEGKTYFIISMAIALSRYFSKKVLIVDTISDNKFLNTIELEMESEDRLISKTVFDNLSIVHLSDLNVHEYQIDSILSSFEDEYDAIFFDTIALNRKNINNIDPIAIGKRCDHRLVVVSRKSISSNSLDRLKNEFSKSEIEITSIIFNEVEAK